MNELLGKYVNVVLSVDHGRGFDEVTAPFYITGNFNGRVMKSDQITPKHDTRFYTEMVWESEKKLLRRARGAYARIRLECFTKHKQYIGHALICLRSAKIIPPGADANEAVRYVWVKLLGVPKPFRRGAPEVSVSLTIRDTQSYVPRQPTLEEMGTVLLQTFFTKHLIVPVKYNEDGFIQIGEITDDFAALKMKFTVLSASHLDVLMPRNLVFTANSVKAFYLVFQIFGMEIKTRPMIKHIYADTYTNETVVIHLRTTLKLLKLYFAKYPKVCLMLCHEDTIFGTSNLDMTKLEFDVDHKEFDRVSGGKVDMNQLCTFDNVLQSDTALAVHEAQVALYYSLELMNAEPIVLDLKPGSLVTAVEEVIAKTPRSPLAHPVTSPETKPCLSTVFEESEASSTCLALLDNRSSVTSLNGDLNSESMYDCYKQFCVDIIVESIQWRGRLKNSQFSLIFEHPKVNTQLELRVNVEKDNKGRVYLEKALCKVLFITSHQRLEYQLKNTQPRLLIHDLQTKKTIGCEIPLDLSLVSVARPDECFVIELKTKTGHVIAKLEMTMFLEEQNVDLDTSSAYDLMPQIIDETLIMHTVKDLEAWKTNKRFQFEEALKAAKKEHLRKVHDEWRLRKTQLEKALVSNIDRCRQLSHDLKKNFEMRRIARSVDMQQQCSLGDRLSLELHKNTIKFSTNTKEELIMYISHVEMNNTIMQEMMSEQTIQMQELHATQLTNEQVKTLLKDLKNMEQKFEKAVLDKNYFKCEYEKAVKEVHQLKLEDHKNITTKIAIEKEALSQLSLDTFTSVGNDHENDMAAGDADDLAISTYVTDANEAYDVDDIEKIRLHSDCDGPMDFHPIV